MRTVMVAKQKGGVGASTAVRELGVAAAAGKRVILIDLDAQGTSRSKWNRRTVAVWRFVEAEFARFARRKPKTDSFRGTAAGLHGKRSAPEAPA